MKTLASVLIIAVAAIATADDKAVRKELEAGYAKFTKAMMAKDVKGLMAIAGPDFQYVSKNGKMNRAQIEAMLTQQFAMTDRFTSATVKINSLTVKGDTVVAAVSNYGAALLKGGEKGKAMKMETKGTSSDTWKKVKGKWLISKVETLTENTLIDGKPIKM